MSLVDRMVDPMLQRDDAGREIFCPWLPWAGPAYLVPDERGASLRRFLRRAAVVGLVAMFVLPPVRIILQLPVSFLVYSVGLLMVAYGVAVRRYLVGLERVDGGPLGVRAARALRSWPTWLVGAAGLLGVAAAAANLWLVSVGFLSPWTGWPLALICALVGVVYASVLRSRYAARQS
ncbi:MAG: hypothetical protein QNK03_11155 [Myxococcota bacterium]|nr:hypothetical protein [Myxococcota bacterium]